MNRLLAAPFAIASSIAFGSSPSFADFRAQPNPTAAATGRGGGNTVLNDDSSALFTNPAQLAALESGELQVNPALFLSELDYAVPGGAGSTGTLENFAGGASLATPFGEGGAVFALGVNGTYGLAAELPTSSALRFAEPHQLELVAPQFSTGLALPLGDRLAAGATLDLIYADLSYRQAYSWRAAGVALPDALLAMDADGWGVGASLGLSYRVGDAGQLGFRAKLPIDVELDGTFALGGAGRGPLQTDVQLPAELALGYGLQVNDSLRVGADVMWLGWSGFDETVIDAGAFSALLGGGRIPRDWRDTWHAGFGAEYALNEHWTLRGGYQFTDSAVPDRTFTPTIPDSERHQLSVGLGWQSGRHAIDLGYSHSLFADRDISTNRDPRLNGRYGFELGILQLGYRLSF